MTLDPSSDFGTQQLVSLFLGHSGPDIRKNLQKLKEPEIRDLSKLLEGAWRVYRNRDGEEKRKLTRVIVTATVAALEQSRNGRPLPGHGRGRPMRVKSLDHKVHSFNPGDWIYIKNCSGDTLQEKWDRPYEVLQTTFIAVSIREQLSWIYYSRIKKTPTEWRVEARGPLQLKFQRDMRQ